MTTNELAQKQIKLITEEDGFKIANGAPQSEMTGLAKDLPPEVFNEIQKILVAEIKAGISEAQELIAQGVITFEEEPILGNETPSGKNIEQVYRNIGERIKHLRSVHGFTQGAVAEKLKCGRAAVANIEAGRQRLPLHDIITLAKTFNISPEAFMRGLWG